MIYTSHWVGNNADDADQSGVARIIHKGERREIPMSFDDYQYLQRIFESAQTQASNKMRDTILDKIRSLPSV